MRPDRSDLDGVVDDAVLLVLEAVPRTSRNGFRNVGSEVGAEDLRALVGWVDTWNAAAGVTRPEEDVVS